MKLIVGLGNPEEKYKNTRHNAGFMTLDKIVYKISNFQSTVSNEDSNINFQTNNKLESKILKVDDFVFAKPQTYMNKSGDAVKKLLDFYKTKKDDLFVIHDDLDLELGNYKLQKGKGPREHNGLNSIYEKIGTSKFWHVRVGIDNRQKDNRVPGEKYVLGKFTNDELKKLEKAMAGLVEELLIILNN